MYRFLLFDLDGTLTDPKEGITKSVQYALNDFGIDADTDDLTCFIGPPLLESFDVYYGLQGDDGQRAVDRYRERFSEKGLYENEVYPGIPQMLSELKNNGYQIALATSKPEVYARQILEHFELTGYFDFIAGGELDENRCSKSYVIGKVLSGLSIPEADRNQVLMIGDRIHDIEGAGAWGIDCLGVDYGYAPEGELVQGGAVDVVKTVEELRRYLLVSKE